MQEEEQVVRQEIKDIKHTLSELTAKYEDKFDELSKSIGKTVMEQKESAEAKVNENPLAYMAGAFVGGVFVGYLLGRGKG
ncbi:MAG: hypothetical protein OIN86_06640 [Candidatus Methanoperedens sp.]|nr:hypothetical protein [Candidatus Methanoperedens sp.]CAG0955837.1 hypothetical protein METP1_00442 [Methanosarcinales archaeon]